MGWWSAIDRYAAFSISSMCTLTCVVGGTSATFLTVLFGTPDCSFFQAHSEARRTRADHLRRADPQTHRRVDKPCARVVSGTPRRLPVRGLITASRAHARRAIAGCFVVHFVVTVAVVIGGILAVLSSAPARL